MGAFDDLEVFVRVVETGGFARAGAAMNLSRSRVSERVAALEARIGARLFERSTRKVAPTDAGRALYARARRALDEAMAGRDEVTALVAEPMGTLRVAAPETFGELYVLPALVEFLGRHPRLKADLDEGPGRVDLVEGGYDLAIRITGDPDPALIVRRIATSRVIIAAAPTYLAARGVPAHPRDVAAHDCVGYAPIFWGREWRFRGPEGPLVVPVAPRLLCSSSPMLRAAALEGAGLTALPFWTAADALADGRLVEVLDDWETPESGVYAVYPSNRMVTPRVRGFVDLLARRLRERLPERPRSGASTPRDGGAG